MERRVRVRFAPSPTGALHIGGVRTALYNYLFARQHGGDMLLRIEDTDSTRFVPGAEEYILEALEWLGIGIDEGLRMNKGKIEAVGAHGPYRQSERREIYHQYVKQLLDSGHAYIAFDTPEELEALRQLLALDPRPQYHDDPERVYGFPFGKFDIRFRVADGTLHVVEAVSSSL